MCNSCQRNYTKVNLTLKLQTNLTFSDRLKHYTALDNVYLPANVNQLKLNAKIRMHGFYRCVHLNLNSFIVISIGDPSLSFLSLGLHLHLPLVSYNHMCGCHKSGPNKPGQEENRQRKCAQISPLSKQQRLRSMTSTPDLGPNLTTVRQDDMLTSAVSWRTLSFLCLVPQHSSCMVPGGRQPSWTGQESAGQAGKARRGWARQRFLIGDILSFRCIPQLGLLQEMYAPTAKQVCFPTVRKHQHYSYMPLKAKKSYSKQDNKTYNLQQTWPKTPEVRSPLHPLFSLFLSLLYSGRHFKEVHTRQTSLVETRRFRSKKSEEVPKLWVTPDLRLCRTQSRSSFLRGTKCPFILSSILVFVLPSLPPH